MQRGYFLDSRRIISEAEQEWLRLMLSLSARLTRAASVVVVGEKTMFESCTGWLSPISGDENYVCDGGGTKPSPK
jgi:hypothetical protein